MLWRLENKLTARSSDQSQAGAVGLRKGIKD